MIIFRIVTKFKQILSLHQKVRVLELAVLMIFAAFMEMLTVSMIYPFMQAVMEPQQVMKNQYISLVCALFNIEDYRILLVLLASFMAIVYILKNLFLMFQIRCQSRFVYYNMHLAQREMLHSYLIRPYEFFLNAKSGEIIRVIQYDTYSAYTLLMDLLSLLSETFVSIVLIGTVFFISPTVIVGMASILFILLIFILRIIKPIIAKNGDLCRNSQSLMSQWMIQSIQGIKEIKITQKEDFFEEAFAKSGNRYVRARYKYEYVSIIPRFLLEAVCMSVFFMIVAIMIYAGASFEQIIPMLSGVAMAAVRLLPATNRISQSVGNMTFNEKCLDKMIDDIRQARKMREDINNGIDEKKKDEIVEIDNLNKEIMLNDVTYKYPHGEDNILYDANMKIKKGESIGIIGSSGAGKTTSVDIILGLLKPQNGTVEIDGVNIEVDRNGWLSQVGYIPQTIFMLDGSVRQNVAFGLSDSSIDDDKVWTALEEAAIDDFVRTMPDGINTEIGERGICLSGGQRQRIGIARALYGNPAVLFFDEATSALDHDTETAIMESIQKLKGKITMIIIAHRLSTIENCDHIYKVEDKKISKVR